MSELPRDWVRFFAGGALYAFPLGQVREVAVPGTFSRIPRAPAGAVGAMSHHGRVVAVVDLVALEAGAPAASPAFVLLLESGRRELGVGVQRVEGIGPLDLEEGEASHGGRPVVLLDREVVFEAVDLAFSEAPVLNG